MEKRPITYVKLPRKLKKAFRTGFIPKRYYRSITVVIFVSKYPRPKAAKYINAYIIERDSRRMHCMPDELFKKYSCYSKQMLDDYYEINPLPF